MSAPFTVFLDRDGVFDVSPRLVIMHWGQWKWIPGAREAFARLNLPHIRTCLATNQPYVGMGLLPARRLSAMHDRMRAELEAAGGRLDHVEVAGSPWPVPSRRRKPAAGLLAAGARHLTDGGWAFDKKRAVMVGDLPKDAAAARRFGIEAILVATTHTRAWLQDHAARLGPGVQVADDLEDAVQRILVMAS
ncbi:MAG: HAD-IIIA family hydrolase [Thermoplasmatota archaeon]